jgi:hypothetical protein
LAISNQVGLADRSLLFDSDPGFQIWNQPVSGYRYRTFNPVTGAFGTIEESRVELSSFVSDKFRGLRAVGTRWVVGVEMELEFVFEKRADLDPVDDPGTDQFRKPIYRYDLELDSVGNIIGGEWWTRLHPDVMWTPIRNTTPSTVADDALRLDSSVWARSGALPVSWAEAARLSINTFQPLGRIVRQLFEWSK